MRFFNYESIYIASHGNPQKLLQYFWDNRGGPNFIINERAVAAAACFISERHKAEYLGLCSFRCYETYLETGDSDLSLDLIPDWVPLEILKENPLVNLTKNKIQLLKENK